MGQQPEPYDPFCGTYAKDMPHLDSYIDPGYHSDRADYVRQEEGTYNKDNGHFLCDPCYVDKGMPSAPGGWKCP